MAFMRTSIASAAFLRGEDESGDFRSRADFLLSKLRCEGAVIGIAGKPVQVRNPEARDLQTRDGPFMSSALPIAGFAIIEAADLAAAIEKVSQVPCAVAHGAFEVWP